MKTSTAVITALALSAAVWASYAQDQGDAPRRRPDGQGQPGQGRPEGQPPGEGRGGPQGERGPSGPGGPGGDGQRRFTPPIVAALDANGDGVIDENEMANATAALKKLDKNADGKLTMDEIMPPRGQGQRGPGGPGGEGAPGGQGGRRPGGPGGQGGAPGAPDGERSGRPQRPTSE